MEKPTIHLNGTSRESLVDGYRDAADKLLEAIEALQECAPNARDYYPQSPDTFRVAMLEHTERLNALARVRHDMVELAMYSDGVT